MKMSKSSKNMFIFPKNINSKKRKNKEKQMNFPNLRNSKMENNFILHFLEKTKKKLFY